MKKYKILSKILIATISTMGLIATTSISTSAANGHRYSFDVISDSHIGGENPNSKSNLTTALNYIKRHSMDDFIVMNGDIVDNNLDSSYDELAKIINDVDYNSASRLPYIYFNFGNHEFRENAHDSSSNYQENLDKFVNRTRDIQTKLSISPGISYTCHDSDKSYDLQHAKGNNLFFLGADDVNHGDCAYLHPGYQLKYLEDNISNDLTFTFCHQPPQDTVHGSDSENCIYNTSDLASIIGSHNNTIMFTSHTHNNFSSYDFSNNRNSNFGMLGQCSVFGTSSIMEACQGLHVMVYNDHVTVRGMQYNLPGDQADDICNDKRINLN